MMLRYICSILLALTVAHPLLAQPTLQFKRIEVLYPKIRIAYKVTCNGSFRNDVQPHNFEVFENGIKVKDATLWCPPDVDCCVSVAMVLDRSGSMADERIDHLKAGAQEFIKRLNPDGIPCDEAAIISFAEDVTTDVGMTTSKQQLTAAVNSLRAYGWTALWDATAVGIQELVTSGKNHCKAVVLLSDGGDNRSRYFLTVQSVIRLAQTHGIKVYSIGVGLDQGGIDEQNLQLLSESTGGLYFYSATGSTLGEIYAMIKQSIKDAYQECYIEYESTCPDGTMRTVELHLKDFCGGSAIATRTYTAPLDRSQFKPVRFRLGDADVRATTDVVIPVLLETPVNEIFSKSDIMIGYDRNVLQFVRLSTDGTILDGHAVTYQPFASSVQIRIEDHIELDAEPGVMLYLHFRAGDVASMWYSAIHFINWNFHAYCLYPELFHGTIKIRPREPELHCVVTTPGALNWNDELKRYEPNPFTVTITVYNTGTREGMNVRAVLVTDETAVRLVSPESNMQFLSPRVIPPGGFATASWVLEATKQEDLDSIGIYFSVSSDNFPTFACWERIVIDPALSSAMACDISAPDTVYFRDQYYEPEEFDIQVRAHNVGNGQTKDVRAQLLQDTRFTLFPPASQQLADVLLPSESAEGSFRVRVNPRSTDGYDTLRINIQGDDTSPAWCYHPVWVQRVRMPEFTLLCSADQDSLQFSDEIWDYIPNPFTVTTLAENIGETWAEDCQIMFVGPEYFTPVGSNLRDAGTMHIGDRRREEWTLRALPRNTDGWDTLHFQVTGRGGLGKQIVLAECRIPIFVPAVRRPEYVMECSAPDSLQYIDNRYQPDAMFSVRISNVGTATGRGLNPVIVLPSMISLADGEKAHRYIPELPVGRYVDIHWRLHPEMRAYDGASRLCAQVVDSIGATATCCTDMFIPKTENPILMPSCWAVDTLYIDEATGQYMGNPFDVSLNLTNVGIGMAQDVRASISILGSFMQLLDPVEQRIGDIGATNSHRLVWKLRALKRPEASNIPVLLTITSANHPEITCELFIHVPASQEPILVSDCSSTPEDSLFFDWTTGQYEYPICTLTYTIRNIGRVKAMNVDALLVLPPGVSLLDGESPQRRLSPPDLRPGESATVSWRFRAMRSDNDVDREFRFIARADNASDVVCVDDLFIQGSARHCIVSLPKDVLLRYGQKAYLPLSIDRTIGKDLSEYSLRLEYNSDVIELIGVDNSGALTSLGWVGAKMHTIAPGLVEITDYTTGTPLSTEAGTLLRLYVEGVFNDKTMPIGFGQTALRIDNGSAMMNRGVIRVHTIDGSAIVTNDCLEPLQADSGAFLAQNRPNPFNPFTIISFTLGTEQRVRLVVHDVHGRIVRIMFDDVLPAGEHSMRFFADDLPSGVYFYHLETPWRILSRRMILAR